MTLPTKKKKLKKCAYCKGEFMQIRMAQKICGYECAVGLAKKTRENQDREQKRKNRKELIEFNQSEPSYWRRKVEEWCNRYIRLRDHELPCISCGKFANYYDAGHYISVGAHPELRYNELNIHKQCVACNHHKASNAVVYRIQLIKKIGLEAVEFLEGPHLPAKYTIDDLKDLLGQYKEKVKALQAKLQLTI
jgi:hypothetical protein